jgi:hypothetical protein
MSSSCDKRVWWKNEGGAGERRSTYSGPVCRRARSGGAGARRTEEIGRSTLRAGICSRVLSAEWEALCANGFEYPEQD